MKKKKPIIKLLGSIVIVGIVVQSFSFINSKENMARYKHIKTVKMEKGKFLNAEPTKTMVKMSANTLKAFFKKGEKVPDMPLPLVPFKASSYSIKDDSLLSVTWFGHSSALLEIDGKLVLTDPALSNNAGPTSFTGTKRFHKATPVQISELPNIDIVLLSHDHFDHLDKKSIKELNTKTKHFIVPLGLAKYLVKWGVNADRIKELAWWDTVIIDGTSFISAPARHFSGRGLLDRNTTLWCSWVIQGKYRSVYFSGDSGYQKDFKTIGEKYGPFDLSLLECGQYNDDWGLIHMSPEESVQAGLDTRTKVALPIHWGAFNLAVHSWNEPVERFAKKSEELGLRMLTPKIGERLVINDSVTTHSWWQ